MRSHIMTYIFALFYLTVSTFSAYPSPVDCTNIQLLTFAGWNKSSATLIGQTERTDHDTIIYTIMAAEWVCTLQH